MRSRLLRLLSATGSSSIGGGLSTVGLSLLALGHTHSPLLIAIVAAAARAPGLLITLPFGALIDRVNRRRLMLGLQAIRCLVASAFAACVLAHEINLALIYGAAFALGASDVAFSCMATASLPSIVEGEQLVVANARFDTVVIIGEEIVGPAVGGAAFSLGQGVPFVGDAIGLFSGLLILPGALPDNKPTGTDSTFFTDLTLGAKWFWRSRTVRLLSTLVAMFAFCQAMVMGLLVLFATRDLRLDKSGYGLLLGISAIGSLVGALVASRIVRARGSGWSIVAAGLLSALTYPVLATVSSGIAAGPVLAVEGGAVLLGIVAAQSLRQISVPPEMQGRVASAYLTLILAAYPLGGLAGGLLGEGIGLRWTFVTAGIAQLVVLAWAGPRLVQRSDRPDLSVAMPDIGTPNEAV